LLLPVVEAFIVHGLVHELRVTDSFASALLGALLGSAFHPVRRRIERLMKRLLPRDSAVKGGTSWHDLSAEGLPSE
jgi:hypothetical protein